MGHELYIKWLYSDIVRAQRAVQWVPWVGCMGTVTKHAQHWRSGVPTMHIVVIVLYNLATTESLTTKHMENVSNVNK